MNNLRAILRVAWEWIGKILIVVGVYGLVLSGVDYIEVAIHIPGWMTLAGCVVVSLIIGIVQRVRERRIIRSKNEEDNT